MDSIGFRCIPSVSALKLRSSSNGVVDTDQGHFRGWVKDSHGPFSEPNNLQKWRMHLQSFWAKNTRSGLVLEKKTAILPRSAFKCVTLRGVGAWFRAVRALGWVLPGARNLPAKAKVGLAAVLSTTHTECPAAQFTCRYCHSQRLGISSTYLCSGEFSDTDIFN